MKRSAPRRSATEHPLREQQAGEQPERRGNQRLRRLKSPA
jgi:hypothetical protein